VIRNDELRNYYQGEKELFCFVVRMNPCVIHGKDQLKSVGTKGGINRVALRAAQRKTLRSP
jgi:hypothetical protein